jgi:quercetin dioxygenase-like cupin family protein
MELPMNVVRDSQVEYRRVRTVEGLPTRGDMRVKALLGGEQMVMLRIRLPAGAGSPPHTHPHESLCYVVEGKVRVVIGDEAYVLGEGDVCRHPEGVLHSIEGVDDSTVLEIKSPAQPLEGFLGTGN